MSATAAVKADTPNFAEIPQLSGSGEDGKRQLFGYAARYGVESHPMVDRNVHHRPFVEVIQPGAFSESLQAAPDIRALFNHDKSAILARTKSGTLRLQVDSNGLRFDLDIPDTSVGHDVRELVQRGDIDGCSLGMFVEDDEIVPRPGQPTDLRLVRKAILYEITPACVFPAYAQTAVALREMNQPGGEILPTPEIEQIRLWAEWEDTKSQQDTPDPTPPCRCTDRAGRGKPAAVAACSCRRSEDHAR